MLGPFVLINLSIGDLTFDNRLQREKSFPLLKQDSSQGFRARLSFRESSPLMNRQLLEVLVDVCSLLHFRFEVG